MLSLLSATWVFDCGLARCVVSRISTENIASVVVVWAPVRLKGRVTFFVPSQTGFSGIREFLYSGWCRLSLCQLLHKSVATRSLRKITEQFWDKPPDLCLKTANGPHSLFNNFPTYSVFFLLSCPSVSLFQNPLSSRSLSTSWPSK